MGREERGVERRERVMGREERGVALITDCVYLRLHLTFIIKVGRVLMLEMCRVVTMTRYSLTTMDLY